MNRNLIKDEERKMRQDAVATEIKKDNFINEIIKEPNKEQKKLGFFDKIKKLFK